MSEPRVCVLGSFMMDLAVRAPRRPLPGETLVGMSFEMFLGGKGFNQAIAAARAGVATDMVGRVGADDFGARFLDCLASDGIGFEHVVVDAESGTGIGLPLVEDSGENSIVIVPRANTRVTPDVVAAARRAITGADVLLLQLELPLEANLAAAAMAHDAGVTVVLNPAPAVVGVERFAGSVDLVVPNAGEASQLAGTAYDAGPEVAADALRRMLGCAVVVTLGKAGVLVADEDAPVIVPAHDVDVVDSVGAGDAFCGVLGAELARGAGLRAAVERANAAAALSVTTAGAEPSMPTSAAVDELLGRSPARR